MPAAPPAQRPTRPWLVRVTHWLNVLSLICLAGSGLQILVAFPNFGPRGDPAPWYPFPDRDPVRRYSGVKLGYKAAKYLTSVKVTPDPTGGYWEEQG
jgi:hypothetical protein